MKEKMGRWASGIIRFRAGYFISLVLILCLPLLVAAVLDGNRFTVICLVFALFGAVAIASLLCWVRPLPERRTAAADVRRAVFWVVWSVLGLLSLAELFLVLNFDTFFSPSIVQILHETDVAESTEFLEAHYLNFANVGLTVLFFFVLLLPVYFNTLLGRSFDMGKIRILLLIAVVGGCGVEVIHLAKMVQVGLKEKKYDRYLPQDNLMLGYRRYEVFRDRDVETLVAATGQFEREPVSSTFESPNIVLVMGESFNKYHSSLYGYRLQTNPLLEKRRETGNLFVFEDVVTPSNTTSQVLKKCLSLRSEDMDGGDVWAGAPIFPAIFRKCGYRSLMVSNQVVRLRGTPHDLKIGYYLNQNEIEASAFDARNPDKFPYDGELVDAYRKLGRTDSCSLVFFHLMGQHTRYNMRYPADWAYFTADSVGREELAQVNRQQIADYDNATRYNDYVMDRIIGEFEHRDAVLVYCADHGQEVNDYRIHINRSYGLHSRNAIKYQFEIPFMIWVSDTYKERHPEMTARIAAAVGRPFMIDDLAQLLFDLGGVECRWSDRTRSVISDDYIARPRRLCEGRYIYEEVMKPAG